MGLSERGADRKFATLGRLALKADDLPFLKRKPYEAESEYRIMYVEKKMATEFKTFPINPARIR